MANTSSVSELVLRWQELRDRGQSVSAEELCAGCPEQLEELKRQIEALRSMQQFLGTSMGDAPGAVTPELLASGNRAEIPPTVQRGEEAATPASDAPLEGSRYRPLRLHAEGGLGAVFVAWDEELSREVALKRIRRPHAQNADSRRRFLREGAITGSLEHPGVVPVYGLTRDASGQPCYAMRFVRGQTLQEAIARFHGTDKANRSLVLRQLLSRLVAVCNTIAYAHSRGVVHRDLKPSNIMLGDYGETLVIDWGLAKRLDDGHGAAAPGGDGSPHAPPDGRHEGTATGDLLGTPAFMSPEQASGRPEAVGPASDIYSLGATLYALLTGRPPFHGDGLGELLQKVGHGDFPAPRQIRPDTPRGLEAICLKAMAREPSARYATALELAADLEHWMADEPVRAHREPWTAWTGRWVRRHRTLVASLTAVLLVSGLLVGATGGWLAARQADTVRAARTDLEEATLLQRQEQWADARAALQRAEGRLSEGGPEDVRQLVARVRADLDMVARLDKIRLGRSVIRNDTLEFDTASTAKEYANAFRDYGLDMEGEVPAVAEAVRQSSIKPQLLGGLDDWAEHTSDARLSGRLLAVVRQADPDPWRDRFRDPELRRDVPALRRLASEASLDALSPMVLEALVNRLEGAGIENQGLLRQIHARYPHDYFLNAALMVSLANQAQRLRWPETDLVREEAIGFAHTMLAVRPDSALAWSDLGVLLFDRGRMKEAEAAQRKALSLQPDNPRFHAYHSGPLRELGRLDEAEQAARTAIRLKPDYGIAYSFLANTLLLQKRFAEAEVACHTAIRLQAKSPWPFVFLARIARARERPAEADALEREAERLRPGSVSAQQLRPWEQTALLESKLPDWLHGKARPADALELAVLGFIAAHNQEKYDATAQLFAKSFAEHPAYAEATVAFSASRPRYFAACCAAQASRGLGDGAFLKLDERSQRRQQALEWLRQELAYWDKQMVDRQPAAHVRASKALSFWREDGWLAGVRDVGITDRLPLAEKEACRKLWANVDELLKRASTGLDEANQVGPGR